MAGVSFVSVADVETPIAIEQIPDDFKVEETIISVRKDEVRKAMLDGEIIPGAHLERGRRLPIK